VLGPTELVVDVSGELPFEERSFLAASVHLPDLDGELPRAVLICWPGGSYARAYWDMHVSGHRGYSFAEHMTAQGFVVVAADHLGVGASSKPVDGDQVNFATMGAAAASFVAQVGVRLADGSAEFGGRPLPEVPVLGVGHSLGACLHRGDAGATSLLRRSGAARIHARAKGGRGHGRQRRGARARRRR
jgi:predicted alpha/beta hydrolase